MDDYFLECDLARANDISHNAARIIIASVRKAGYEVTKPKRRNMSRTETAQKQPTPTDSNVNETATDGA